MKRLRQNAQSLKFRPEDFPKLLVDIGFEPPVNLGTAGQGGMSSCILTYRFPFSTTALTS
jgi:hypothetical protein